MTAPSRRKAARKRTRVLPLWMRQLKALGPCAPAWRWLMQLRKERPRLTWQQTWDACTNHDWLLWALGTVCHPSAVVARQATTRAYDTIKHSGDYWTCGCRTLAWAVRSVVPKAPKFPAVRK